MPVNTKKSIPADWRGWTRELIGVFGFVMRMEEYAPKNGQKWAGKQLEYYQARLIDLLSNPPKLPSKYKWTEIKERFKCLQ